MPYEGQRCFLTTVWLIGVYCIRCALCIAHSKGHWLSGSLLWDSKSISKFCGGGPNFHAFNESRQPCVEAIINPSVYPDKNLDQNWDWDSDSKV